MRLAWLLFMFAINSTCLSQAISIAESASNFISGLNAEQQSKAVFAFNNNERYNWHFFPKADRQGIPLSDLNEQQKKLAFALLKNSLSEAGYDKSVGIIHLEGILRALENRRENDEYRDPGKYYFIVFGAPSEKGVWGWRLEGHHLSLNFSTIDNKIVSGTPAFMGTNPAIVPSGPEKGKQVLKEEADLAFSLLHSLNRDQLAKAIIDDDAPNEIITFVSRKALIKNPQGLLYSEMTSQQKEILLQLIGAYIHRYTKLFADGMLQQIKDAGLNRLQFAWAGGQEPNTGKPHYYRIQGPTIIIEYDNSQNNANHVHSVVRDLKNDFGGDELLEHYRRSHKKYPLSP